MIETVRSSDQMMLPADVSEPNTWTKLISPTEEEIQRVAAEGKISPALLRTALDDEERSRIESEAGEVLILIDIPIETGEPGELKYSTLPLGIVVTRERIVTVALSESPIFKALESKMRGVSTAKRTRFVLQILYQTAAHYLMYLRRIDRQITQTEEALHRSTQNEHLFRLMNLQKSLVYFTTSLKANQIVLEKLLRSQFKRPSAEPVGEATPETSHILQMYAEDEELLEDVITENKQAIEMGDIYTNILAGLMDAFASVVSNNLNIVMRFLAIVTIVLAIPTSVFSFYGMNVALPLQDDPWAWVMALGFSVVLSIVGVLLLSYATSRPIRNR